MIKGLPELLEDIVDPKPDPEPLTHEFSSLQQAVPDFLLVFFQQAWLKESGYLCIRKIH